MHNFHLLGWITDVQLLPSAFWMINIEWRLPANWYKASITASSWGNLLHNTICFVLFCFSIRACQLGALRTSSGLELTGKPLQWSTTVVTGVSNPHIRVSGHDAGCLVLRRPSCSPQCRHELGVLGRDTWQLLLSVRNTYFLLSWHYWSGWLMCLPTH